VHPLTKTNYLASPPLVVVYALAGSTALDISTEPIGLGKDGKPVYLKDIWPTNEEITAAISQFVTPEMFRESYADVFTGTKAWQMVEVTGSELYAWNENSTYRLSEIKLPKIPLEYAHLTILGDHINGSVSNIFFQSAIRKTTGKFVNRVQIKKYSSIPISNSTDLLWRRARNKGDCNTVWNKRQNCRQLVIKIHVRRNRLDNG
jgi:aconitase A